MRSELENRAILNLGGIANITYLNKNPKSPVIGFDTGPANGLLDAWAQQHTDQSYDKDGKMAASGTANHELLDELLDDPYFARSYPKSTGKEYFNLSWLEPFIINYDLSTADVAACLNQLTAITICDSLAKLPEPPNRVIACGGGVHNKYLMQTIRERLGDTPLDKSDQHGIDADWVEAIAFAWLAFRSINQLPGNEPSTTGASGPRVLGGIYPR